MRKLVYAVVALLLVGLPIALVEARGRTYVISPSDEAFEKIQLSPSDNVVGNMSVSNGFVDFFVTNPSYDIVHQSKKTSFDSFNFTANESGVYVMHFVNKYQLEDVNVTLSYGLNIFVSVGTTIHVSTQTFWSNSVTVTPVQQRYIILDVSPLAFPVAGQSWKISVFYQNQSIDGIPHYSPLPNATVEITVIVDGQKKVYSYTLDALGHLEFKFLAEYSDISFQAVSGENRSDIFALTQRSEHYVSADFVNFMFALSGVMSGITIVASAIVFHFRKRTRAIFGVLVGAVFCLSLVQLVISVYSILFLWTPWGYTESIFSFFTWTSLRYASLIGIVLFAILNLLALFLRLRKPKRGLPLKR